MLVIRNDDQPGVIGEVGTILGRHGINIASFALGRGPDGAVGVVNVDAHGSDAATKRSARSCDLLRCGRASASVSDVEAEVPFSDSASRRTAPVTRSISSTRIAGPTPTR